MVPERCETCGYEWRSTPADAVALIEDAPSRYEEMLRDRDGMVPAQDEGWNATSYLWHLVDLARSWSERWVQVASDPGAALVGWDPDVLADARGYRSLPTSAALWALRDATATFVRLTRSLDETLAFRHGDWGVGNVADATRWLAHEFVHHVGDADARAAPAKPNGVSGR